MGIFVSFIFKYARIFEAKRKTKDYRSQTWYSTRLNGTEEFFTRIFCYLVHFLCGAAFVGGGRRKCLHIYNSNTILRSANFAETKRTNKKKGVKRMGRNQRHFIKCVFNEYYSLHSNGWVLTLHMKSLWISFSRFWRYFTWPTGKTESQMEIKWRLFWPAI